MANPCSIVNKSTNEPKVFYKTDGGSIVSSLQEAISQSINSYEFGIFKNETDFKSLGKSPIYDKLSKEGIIQELIGDGLLEAKVVNGKQIFSSTGETPLIQGIVAEGIEDMLRSKVGGAHFIRKGETFDIPLNSEYDNMIKNSVQYNFDEALDKFSPEKAADMNLFKIFSNIKKQFKDSKYDDETLIEAIEDLLGDLGVSVTNIENYKKNYEIKNGVEPSAEALADISNRIIAVAEGKETLDNLTEETSHFIVEGWNSEEIDRLLEFIPQTTQYKENAPSYREVYNKEGLSKEAVETKVKKEILGKILAETLNSNTDLSSKTEVERNIFKKVFEYFEKWLNNLINKITPTTSESITEFAEEVKKLLYNKKLASSLDLSNSEGTYYALSNDPTSPVFTNETGRLLDQLFSQFKTSKIGNSNVVNFLAVMNVIERNIDKINSGDVGEHQQEIKTLVDEVAPIAKRAYNRVIQETETDPHLQLKIRKAYKSILNNLSDLETDNQQTSSIKFEELLSSMLDSFNRKNSNPIKQKEFEKSLLEKLNSVQKDSSWFGKMFMPLYLSSNIFQQMMGSIMMKMWVNVNLTMEREITPRIYKLADNIKAVQGLMGDNFIQSFSKNDILQKDMDTLKKQILKDNFPNAIWSETDTMGDIEHGLKEDLPLFKAFFNIAIKNGDLPGVSLKKADQLDMYEKLQFITNENGKLKINNSTINQFKVYLNHKQEVSSENSRIRKEYDITDDNFHIQQSVTKRWIGERKSIFSQDIDMTTIDSGKFTNFVSTMNEFLKDGLSLSATKTKNSIEINMLNNDGTKENLYLKLTDPNNDEAVIAFYEQAASFYNAEKMKNNDPTSRQSNFKKAWDHFVNSFPEGTSQDKINESAVNWVKYNSSFSTDNSFENSGSKFNKTEIIDAIGQDKWDSEVETLVGQIDALYRQKSAILGIVREAGDFKEIAGSEISESQKNALRDIESKIGSLIKDLSEKTGEGTDIFESMLDDSIITSANKSYMKLFSEYEVKYEDATLEELEAIFRRESDISKVDRYFQLKTKFGRLIKNGTKSKNIDVILKDKKFINDISNKLGYTNSNALLEALDRDKEVETQVYRSLMEVNLPSEYKRFDKEEHLKFIREVENGMISIKDLVDGRVALPEDLLLEPSFIHDSEFDNSKTKKELIIEYAENAETLTNNEKFEILKQLDDSNQFELEDKYKNKNFIKDINANKTASPYLALMDMMVLSLHNYGKYNHNVFSLPNFRKTERDTFVALATSKSKQEVKAKLKTLIQETIAYREDEMADTTRGEFSFVPKTGFMPLSKDERSTDMIHLYSKMLSQSILYKNRSESLKDALVVVAEAESKQYKGTSTSQSKTIQKLKDFIDLELYGKKELKKLEHKVFGHTVDFSKLIHSGRKFITSNALGLSPIIAATAYTTSRTGYEILKRSGLNREIYMPSDSRASLEWKKLLSGTISSIGTIDGASKLEEILRMFGGYSILERTSNAKFNRAFKVLETEKIAYGALKMAEHPILSKLVLSKLMEYRMISGKFMTFEEYKNYTLVHGSTKTETEIKKEFDAHSGKSLYDYTMTDIDADSLFKEAIVLDPSLNQAYISSKNLSAPEKISLFSKSSNLFKESIKNRINLIQLSKDGYDIEDNLDDDLINISLQIADIKSRLTQQLPKGASVLAQNDVALSFLMTFRQWLVQTIHNSLVSEGTKEGLYVPFNNFNTGVTQIGQLPSLYNLIARSFGVGNNSTEENKKAFFAFKTAWKNSDASEKVALRGLAMSTVLWIALGGLTAAALGYADDDDEKDNVLLQFNAYLLERTMKEGFGSSNPVGLFNELIGILSNPITVARNVKGAAGLLAVWNMNDKVKSGPYEGWSQYWTDAFKLTLMKNVYSQSSGEGLKTARAGYRHFSESDGTGEWFSPFEAVKVFEPNEDEE